MKTKTIKTINLLDLLDKMDQDECEQLGMEWPERGISYTLPDGTTPIGKRAWDLISGREYGNQRFTNDSLYIFTFNTFNGEPFANGVEAALYAYCVTYDALENEQVVFEVSW